MSRFGFDKMLRQMQQVKRDLPQQIGNMGVRHFMKSFTQEGFTDKRLEPWPERKDKKNTRPLLVGKSGGTRSGAHIHLRSSVNNSLKRAVWQEILFAVPQPYARIHNEGGVIHQGSRSMTLRFRREGANSLRFTKNKRKGVVSMAQVESGPRTITIPQRKFMGYSYTMNMSMKNKVNLEMFKVLKRR